MPHLRCTGCGVVSYAPVRENGPVCPECGLPWPARPEEVVRSADPELRLGALVRMTRDLLDADVAMLTEVRGDHEHARLAAGDWPELGPLEGRSLPLEDTFCRLMLEGRIPHAVPDAPADPRVADLPIVSRFHVHAYLGVPIRPSDAELYVLCCLAREARPGLGAREVRLLSGLAASVRAELQSD
jgi:GAF domain-containing protein